MANGGLGKRPFIRDVSWRAAAGLIESSCCIGLSESLWEVVCLRTVRVRRDRPSALTWAVALAITMLMVYLLTLGTGYTDVVESVSSAPRVTRAIQFDALKRY